MEPEIARRCLSCGASVRGRASFCPQCGQPMDGAQSLSAQAEGQTRTPPPPPPQQQRQSGLVDEAARVAAALNDQLPTLSGELRAPAAAAGGHATAPEATREADTDASEAFDAQHAGSQSSGMREEAGAPEAATVMAADTRASMRQRAASVGATVGGNLRPRVEKLREASTVVFDEASDDPGLRFVIIAALLFLLFLFILLFSYILG